MAHAPPLCLPPCIVYYNWADCPSGTQGQETRENDYSPSSINEQLLISKGSPQLFAILTPQPNNLGERETEESSRHQKIPTRQVETKLTTILNEVEYFYTDFTSLMADFGQDINLVF